MAGTCIRKVWWMSWALVAAVGCGAEAVPPYDGSVRDDGGATDGETGDDVPVTEDRGGDDADATETCVPGAEVCDGLDNDCDTLTDEDFDLTNDPANCGGCGLVCDPAHAEGECAGGVCSIIACTPGWVDVNGSWVDGCEYECTASATAESPDDGTCSDGFDNDCDTRTDRTDMDCEPCVPEFCDGLDNDCDGLTDEDFDRDFDARNCGTCGNICPDRTRAVAVCVLGTCDIECEPGYENRDLIAANGCEAGCVPAADPNEVPCNGVDDDCDGRTDEDYLPYRCGGGPCERNSLCHRGAVSCAPRDPPATTDATCDNVDDDCDGTVDEDWVSTGCVGACIDTATCREGVPACGTPAPADTACDGIDDDCDGVADEDYVTTTCGLGACQRTSMCLLGIERCREGSPTPEICNGIDDDCEGTTDNPPPAPAVLCPPAPNGIVECTGGACTMTSCDAGWVDGDGSAANGCECQLEPSEGSGGTCATAIDLGAFPDSGADTTIRGKIAPAGDEDWYRFDATDSPDTTCDAYNVDVRFQPGGNPGTVFRIDVHRGSCAPSSCTNIPDRYSWYTDYTEGAGATRVGECQCRTSNTDGYNTCNDDTSVYYIRVYRAAEAAPDCAEYSLRITNGVF